LVRWRKNSAKLFAPRQLLAAVDVPNVQPCPVCPAAVLPLVKVVKKFSTLKLATFTLPPTFSGAAVRGLARTKTGATVGCSL
jgi:hypothetical protein